MHNLPLRLIIQDEQDLLVASAHLQGATHAVQDMVYQPAHKRFALVAQREGQAHSTAIHFEYVERVQTLNLPDAEAQLTWLACIFEPTDAPAGIVTLYYEDAPRIRLFVECLEAQMKDLTE